MKLEINIKPKNTKKVDPLHAERLITIIFMVGILGFFALLVVSPYTMLIIFDIVMSVGLIMIFYRICRSLARDIVRKRF